jgi:hypothetical protein
MSKKKKAPKKAAKPAPKKAKMAAPPRDRTSAATIFVYEVNGQCRVRTSPQMLSAGDGFVEWTVVNLTSGPMPDVDITWRNGSPWGGQAIPVRNGMARLRLAAGQPGHFKYNVSCQGFTEDPELEYPVN